MEADDLPTDLAVAINLATAALVNLKMNNLKYRTTIETRASQHVLGMAHPEIVGALKVWEKRESELRAIETMKDQLLAVIDELKDIGNVRYHEGVVAGRAARERELMEEYFGSKHDPESKEFFRSVHLSNVKAKWPNLF